MEKADNPFNPNTTVAPLLFAGRAEQTTAILARLNQVKSGRSVSFILHGILGIGKTALAKLINYAACGQAKDSYNFNFLTSYFVVDKNRTLQSVLESSLNALTDDLPQDTLKALTNKLGNIFQNGKFAFGAFSVNASLDNTESAEQKMFFTDQIISGLSNLIKEAVIDNPKFDGLLIIIDEMYNIVDLQEAASVFKKIINTLDFRERGYISFILIGYSQSVDDFFKNDSSARRSFNLTKLEVMPDTEAQDVLIKGFNKIGYKYDNQILKDSISITGGYPHVLQILGKNLVNTDQDQHIDATDWQIAIKQSATELQTKDFFDLYSFTNKQTIKNEIMNVLALSNGHFLITKSGLKHLFGNNVYKYIKEMIKLGAVKEDELSGQLKLQSQLFSAAILFSLKSDFPLKYEKALQHIKLLKQKNSCQSLETPH